MEVLLGKVGVLMNLTLAGAVVLYFVEPFGALIFILLTGFNLYDLADQPYVILAMIFLGLVKKFMSGKGLG